MDLTQLHHWISGVDNIYNLDIKNLHFISTVVRHSSIVRNYLRNCGMIRRSVCV